MKITLVKLDGSANGGVRVDINSAEHLINTVSPNVAIRLIQSCGCEPKVIVLTGQVARTFHPGCQELDIFTAKQPAEDVTTDQDKVLGLTVDALRHELELLKAKRMRLEDALGLLTDERAAFYAQVQREQAAMTPEEIDENRREWEAWDKMPAPDID